MNKTRLFYILVMIFGSFTVGWFARNLTEPFRPKDHYTIQLQLENDNSLIGLNFYGPTPYQVCAEFSIEKPLGSCICNIKKKINE